MQHTSESLKAKALRNSWLLPVVLDVAMAQFVHHISALISHMSTRSSS